MNKKRNLSLERLLPWCGIVSPVLFWGGVAILATMFPGYSHLRDTVSELGARGTPSSIWQNLNFAINGLLMAAFAVSLHRALPAGNPWGPGLLAVFGLIGLLGSGLLPCDLGCQGTTQADQLHFIPSSIGFPSLIAALFVLPRRMHQGDWRSFRAYTKLTAWLALTSFMVLNLAFIDVLTAAAPYAGLLQRVFTGLAFLWILLASVRILRSARIARPRA